MKKYIDKKTVFLLIFFFFWIYPITVNYMSIYVTISLASVVLSTILIYKVKNTGIKFAMLAIISTAVCLYDFSYFTLYVSALFLTAAYICHYEKEKTKVEMAGIYVTLSYMSNIINIIYSVVSQNTSEVEFSIDCSLNINTLWFFAVYIALLIVSFNKKHSKEEKRRVISMRKIYIAALIGLAIAYFTYICGGDIYNVEKIRISFAGWFTLVVTMCVYDNSEIKSLISKAEKMITA